MCEILQHFENHQPEEEEEYLTNLFDKPRETHTVYLYVAIHYHILNTT